jgi:hypothetical protein
VRKLLLTTALALTLAVAPAASAAKTITLQVTSVALSVKSHDRPPKGASKGDTIVQRDRLLNAVAQFGRKKGATVGSDHGTMTFTSAHAARFTGVVVLPKGTLTLNGKVTAATGGILVIPVTGGTGAYAGAKGIVLVGPGEKRALNVYRFTIASGNVA